MGKKMLTTIKEPFVIISANTEGQTNQQSVMAHLKLKQKLNDLGYNYKVVYGKYNGKTETSLYVPHLGPTGACDLCSEFKQQTYLDVDENREARLVNVNTLEREQLGYFMKGEDDDNYTIDEGVKYVCRG
jgi:hypothetical protein